MNHWRLGLLGIAVIAMVGCNQSEKSSSASNESASAVTTDNGTPTPAAAGEVMLPNGLKYVELKVGDGALAESGKNVSVHYTGWLVDGTKFDSSVDRNEPFNFRLGTGAVIRGWDEGVKGMRVGGKRKLTIPADLGYGAQGAGPIPPNATLVFDVELLGVQ
jgi:FKBP-type peptidyl-prolyl cis-trans isomerase